jgi:hypothetical protein
MGIVDTIGDTRPSQKVPDIDIQPDSSDSSGSVHFFGFVCFASFALVCFVCFASFALVCFVWLLWFALVWLVLANYCKN